MANHYAKNVSGVVIWNECFVTASAKGIQRPSIVMRESLAHHPIETIHALEDIWDCVGVEPHECASQLDDLFQKITLPR